MKKKILNDIRSLILITIIITVLAVLLMLSLISTTDLGDIVIFISVYGGFLIASITWLLLTFEIIFFSDDRIVSIKLFRRIEIFYSEISNINAIDKRGIGAGGIESVWQIQTYCPKTIYVIKSRKREKIIEEIKNSIKK